jgi:hypothetical protein
MMLPGGLPRDGRLRRDFRFKRVTGELERELAESGLVTDTLPQQVTRILSCSLQELAGRPADTGLVLSLSVGDRQFLILQLDELLDPTPRWLTTRCSGCGEPIQFQIVPGTIPVKPAGEAYPVSQVTLSIGEVKLRTPNGADEEAISVRGATDEQALQTLLARLLSVQGRPVDPQRLSAEDLELVDQALDELSPQAGLSASTDCPHCRRHQEVEIDPYAWLQQGSGGLDQQVHTLALHYHWSEREILQLPRSRRERYLQLIDRSLGKYRADELIQGASGGGW